MSVQVLRLDPDCGDVVDALEMTDISRSGVGGDCARPMYPGQRVLVCLPLSANGGRRNVYGTIVRNRRRDRKSHHVGIQFDSASFAPSQWVGELASAA